MTFLAMVAAVGALWCWWPGAPRKRLRRLFAASPIPAANGSAESTPGALSLSNLRTIRWISIGAALGLGFLVGAWWGWLLAVALGIFGPRLLGQLEGKAERARREAVQRQSADAADLLAACLASGAPVSTSVVAVANALGQPIARPLRLLTSRLALGADPVQVWQLLAHEPGLSTLAHHVARSLESGAPLLDVLPGLGVDLRRQARVQAETAARAAGVKAVAPLAVCFLPAFLLVGVVPIVASLALPYLAGGVT